MFSPKYPMVVTPAYYQQLKAAGLPLKNVVESAPVKLSDDELSGMTVQDAIPETWIKRYMAQLLWCAAKFKDGSAMQIAALQRADHAMDIVKAYRDTQRKEG